MLPSLIADELRGALSGYLGTTFALADDDVREQLETFLTDPEHGIFRGPYVRLRLPFQQADHEWRETLDWSPPGFTPYRHQAEAFRRLSSKSGRPEPTLVTTGTGSGKTESFLIPVLDHCRRARAAGRQGIKALVLYPMNALANDQARRIADMIDNNAAELGGVTWGLYTGDNPQRRRELRDNPPDILLTNYKMLDFLLLRPEDQRLWSASKESLQYLVLDEFHTYDGAQGTDVAMLLRRFGMALGVSEPGRPLGRITPVATSATLGDGRETGGRLLEFAGRVFGEPFETNAVIGEQRMSVAEWLRESEPVDLFDYEPLPLLERLPRSETGESHTARLAAAAQVFFRDPATAQDGNPAPEDVDDRELLGKRLRNHPFTAVLLAAAATPRPLRELTREVAPEWFRGHRAAADRAAERALSEFLALLSHARSGDRPLLQVEIQLWIREVSLVDRLVDGVPGFRWGMDGSRADIDDRYLPAVYCRHCGRSGWGAARRSREVTLDDKAPSIRQQSVRRTGRFRALIHAPGEDKAGEHETLSWLDPVTLELTAQRPAGERDYLPVLTTPDDEAAKKDSCPSCGLDDGIRFLGSRVATLTSVTLGHLFGSADVEPEQKKTLVFTDSVQDAAHRAAFIESRSYALNFRSLLCRAAGSASRTLGEIDSSLIATAATPEERYALIPPDLATDDQYRTFWQDGRSAVRGAVKRRVGFAAALEFGLNARTGRTLELTGTMVAHVDGGAEERLRRIAASVIDEHATERGQLDIDIAQAAPLAWVRGVLERMRLRGGITHPFLTTFIREDGSSRWSIWGGRPAEMPAFPKGRPAPAFPTTAAKSEAFDSVVARGTWYGNWTARTLRVPEAEAPFLVRRLFEQLLAEGVTAAATTNSGATVYYLDPDSVVIDTVSEEGDDSRSAAVVLRCDVCSHRHPAVPEIARQLADAPCLRNKCPGTLRVQQFARDYYRGLYSSGRVRRISAHEHTGLLDGQTRVEVEKAFKSSHEPDAPNVLACTPTLELGIDIGDLSAVGLTSLPRSVAGYLQRVGRAGRHTGSALVFAVLPGRGIELHWLAEPLDMIAGEVTPPACYLDAAEILRRQYFASLIDRAARSGAGTPPRTAGKMLTTALADGSWLRDLLRGAREHAEAYVAEFLAGFRGHLATGTEQMLADWAGIGLGPLTVSPMERAVERAVQAWNEDYALLQQRAQALEEEIDALRARESLLSDEGQRDLKRVTGEHRAAVAERGAMRRQYWITAFEGLGLLPNYTLLDDRTRLDVGLTWTDDRTGATAVERASYERGSRVALTELAPGSTFYVRGTALKIDAVDLGTERNPALLPWRFCPSCGWSARDTGPTSCPRCDDNHAADTGQVLSAVRFRKASAFAPRDSVRFGDEDDDRRRSFFTVAHAVDVDPVDVTRAWGLRDYPFGAEFAQTADIRWVNLGRADGGGADRTIAGETVQAPLFLACRHCGVVPGAQGRDPADARHRGWCPQRRISDPDGWSSVALLHELRTQVVRLLVPPIVIADDIVLESVRAALLLGLRKVLGGEPDNLDIIVAPDPDRDRERYLLVLHDTVPGGTGYLARFADPAAVYELLAAAKKALADCVCAELPEAACHRCLLPYAPPSKVSVVRRDRAHEVLEEILGRWEPENLDSLRSITVSPHETPIELRLRALLARWAEQQDADPRIAPGQGGDQLTFRLPAAGGGTRTWSMEAQPKLGFVQPDFMLTADDARAPRIAVFCDGRHYHATAEHNRLADDAEKRADLRSAGYLVWAVTHHDLDAFDQALHGTPSGGYACLSASQRAALQKLAGNAQFFGPRRVAAEQLQGDAVTLLTRFLAWPEESAWQPPATALALALTGGNKSNALELTRDEVPEALSALLRGQHVSSSPAGRRILHRTTAGGAVGLLELEQKASVRVYLGVDDRQETIAAPGHEHAWRDWLALSNLLQFLGADRLSAGTATLPVPDADLNSARAETLGRPVDQRWTPLLGLFDNAMDVVVSALAQHELPVPVPGHEERGGALVIDLAWPDERVAVVTGDDPERDHALREDGWVVLPPDVEVIVGAMKQRG